MNRGLTEADLAYNEISSSWESFISNYDTDRRIEVLVKDFLKGESFSEKSILEAGCGLGYFTRELDKLGAARFVSFDIAPRLVQRLGTKFPKVESQVADLLEVQETFKGQSFDLVFSSEVIEHTPDPEKAVRGLCALVKKGGKLVLSCPNSRWLWLLKTAQVLGLRKNYKGFENWVNPTDLLKWIQESGLVIRKSEGIHTVPWQFLPKSILRSLDRKFRSSTYPVALNLAVIAEKPL